MDDSLAMCMVRPLWQFEYVASDGSKKTISKAEMLRRLEQQDKMPRLDEQGRLSRVDEGKLSMAEVNLLRLSTLSCVVYEPLLVRVIPSLYSNVTHYYVR